MELINSVTDWTTNAVAITNIAIAIGTIVLAVGIPLAIKSAGREERDTFYATLDRTYLEIQKLIVEHPHLSQPNPAGKTPEQIVQYDAFAFIVWNFIEAIYDYSKQEKPLAVTWGCVLQYEAGAHSAWFGNAENRKKFKPEFIRHIDQSGFLLKAAEITK